MKKSMLFFAVFWMLIGCSNLHCKNISNNKLRPAIEQLSCCEKSFIAGLPLSKLYFITYYVINPLLDGLRFNEKGFLETYYRANHMGWKINPTGVASISIGALTYFLQNAREREAKIFSDQVNYLQNSLQELNNHNFGWPYEFDYQSGQYYDLKKPWLSGMTSALGAAALARAYYISHDPSYLETMRKVIKTLLRPTAEGGLLVEISKDAWWVEEYPTETPSFVLNGFLYAVYALYEISILCPEIEQEFALKDALEKFRNGLKLKLASFSIERSGEIWSSYDLFELKPELYIQFHPNDLDKDTKIFVHKAQFLGDGKVLQEINIGYANDAGQNVAHVVDNDLYSLGPRRYCKASYFRDLFGSKGKYDSSVFVFYQDFSDVKDFTVKILYTIRTIEKEPENKRLVHIFASDGQSKLLIGGIDSSLNKKIIYTEMLIPTEVIDNLKNQKDKSRNIQDSYHSLHILQLSYWDQIWPEDRNFIQETIKNWKRDAEISTKIKKS